MHGAAAGAGLSLMLMCDFVLAAEGTKFSLGTSCDVGASWALPRLGLINRVLPATELQR